MPHQDNGNETYDFVTSNGTEDAPYTAGDEDNIVTATASVTFETETPTPEPETPTATPTDTPTDTPTPTSEDQPGFGAVLALIALIGAALLAARRNDF
jgi:PGF-CTERM protein